MIHVRIQTYFPCTVQICVNGHDVLARKMDRHHIPYRQIDNAFCWIEPKKLKQAQRFADRIAQMKWPTILEKYARLVNPLLGDVLKGKTHYWVNDQVEYSTDLMFDSPAVLGPLYQQWVKDATLRFTAEDVLTFLGRKLTGHFQGEVLNDYKSGKRYQGARVKHRMKNNWIKMYDKGGQVLRVETVINQPNEFKVRREVTRKGERTMEWTPMRKGVGNLWKYMEVSRKANERYLASLGAVDAAEGVKASYELDRIGGSVKESERSYRGFNPLNPEDRKLFLAVFRGEHHLRGFTNREIRERYFGEASSDRRQANRMSRLLKRLHVHGLIAKVPRSRRWRLSVPGRQLIASLLSAHEQYATVKQAI